MNKICMKTYELHIKNMVCKRCIVHVVQLLHQLNTFPKKVELGHVIFSGDCDTVLPILEQKLNEVGLEVINNTTEVTVEKIKIEIIRYLDEVEDGNLVGKLSEFIADHLAKNYFSLSKLFSENQNKTIEAFAIEQKVNRIKQLLREDELTVSEMAYRLGYSNVQHLSNQFRKITGMSVSEFKNEYAVRLNTHI